LLLKKANEKKDLSFPAWGMKQRPTEPQASDSRNNNKAKEGLADANLLLFPCGKRRGLVILDGTERSNHFLLGSS